MEDILLWMAATKYKLDCRVLLFLVAQYQQASGIT